MHFLYVTCNLKSLLPSCLHPHRYYPRHLPTATLYPAARVTLLNPYLPATSGLEPPRGDSTKGREARAGLGQPVLQAPPVPPHPLSLHTPAELVAPLITTTCSPPGLSSSRGPPRNPHSSLTHYRPPWVLGSPITALTSPPCSGLLLLSLSPG